MLKKKGTRMAYDGEDWNGLEMVKSLTFQRVSPFFFYLLYKSIEFEVLFYCLVEYWIMAKVLFLPHKLKLAGLMGSRMVWILSLALPARAHRASGAWGHLWTLSPRYQQLACGFTANILKWRPYRKRSYRKDCSSWKKQKNCKFFLIYFLSYSLE